MINKKGVRMVAAIPHLSDAEPHLRLRLLGRLVNDLREDPLEIHHLVPQSRSIDVLRNAEVNLRHVPHSLHFAWHYLFSNMTPFDVVVEIVRWWIPAGYLKMVAIEVDWGNEHVMWRPRLPLRGRRHVANAQELEYWFRVFPHEYSFERVLLAVLTEWAPVGYVRRLRIVGKTEEVYIGRG